MEIEQIKQRLHLLAPREQGIIKMRFGLEDCTRDCHPRFEQTHSLDQVARAFGVTRERIRQIEAKCLEIIER